MSQDDEEGNESDWENYLINCWYLKYIYNILISILINIIHIIKVYKNSISK